MNLIQELLVVRIEPGVLDIFSESMLEALCQLGPPRNCVTETEFAYVHSLLLEKMRCPWDFLEAADLLHSHFYGPGFLREDEMKDVADGLLFTCGFFPEQFGAMRQRWWNDRWMLAKMGQFFYHELYHRQGENVYCLLHNHFSPWVEILEVAAGNLKTSGAGVRGVMAGNGGA